MALSARSEEPLSSDKALGSLGVRELLGHALNVRGGFSCRRKWTVRSSRLEIFKSFGFSRVDDAALLRGVFVIRGREFRAVYGDSGCQNDPAARKDGFDKVAVCDASLVTQAVWNGDLALPLNFDDGRHRYFGMPRLPALCKTG